MERPISLNELKIVNWLLDHALIDVTAYRLHPMEELRVVGRCPCGCASLYFEPEGQRGKVQMLADELEVYPDGQRAGLILWGTRRQGHLAQACDCQPESSHRVPDVCNLCTWDDLSRRDLERTKRDR